MSIKVGMNLKNLYEEKGPREFSRLLMEAIEKGEIDPFSLSVRGLAEATMGRDWVDRLSPVPGHSGFDLLEAGGSAVDSTAFSNITGQIVYSTVLQGYQAEGMIGDQLVTTIPTRLSGEKIPGIAEIGDEAEEVNEGEEFPHAGFGEDYIQTPETVKNGLIVPVTKEAIYFDRTNLIVMRARQVGEWLRMRKEKRILDMVIGYTNNYKWKGTSYDTYQAATPWINVGSGLELSDWTDIDEALQLFAAMTDPHTGEAIVVMPKVLLCMPYKAMTAKRILSATEIRHSTGSTIETLSANPVAGSYQILSSALLYARLLANVETDSAKAKLYWFLGDPKRAFAYMENWPITVVQAPSNSEPEFSRDIVLRFKASERGVPAVMDPRYMLRLYST